MAISILASGAETNEKTEFDTYGANVTFSSTSVKNGTYTHVLKYNFIDVDGEFDIVSHMEWTDIPEFRNWYTHFQLRIPSAPAVNVYLCQDGNADDDPFVGGEHDVRVWLTTARKIKVETSSGSTTGTTVLNINQYYRIELRVDKTNDGKVYLKINGNDELNRAIANNAKDRFTYGMRRKDDPGTNPAVSLRMDNIALWTSTAGELPPWLNNTLVNYRTAVGFGNHNQYIGVGDSTNKYNNVDEFSPSDGDTTHNHSVGFGEEKQSHNLANVTPSGTIKGFTLYGRFAGGADEDGVNSTASDNKLHIRDNGVDYDTDFSKVLTDEYHTEKVGYGTRPGGATLTAGSINAMDVGSKVDLSVENNPALSSDIKVTTGDSSVDDDWTSSDFGANQYLMVNGNRTAGNDFIEHKVSGERQGFTFPNITVPSGTIISGLTITALMGHGLRNDAGTVRFYFKTAGGTKYYGSTFSTIGAQLKEFTWGNNPDTSNPFTASEINNGEFGLEIVNGGSDKMVCWFFNLDVHYRSLLKETSYWVTTLHGDAPTTFEDDTTYVNSYIGPSGYY